MKILHLNDEPWDSGVTAYSLQIASLQKKAGHDVTFGARPGKSPAQQAARLSLPVATVDKPSDLRKILRAQTWDIVNVHTGKMHSWSIALRAIGAANFALVRTRGDARAVPSHFLSRLIYRRTDAVITASNHIRDQYVSGFGMTERKVRTIYPSVDLDSPVAPAEPDTVGILGRLDPVKGHTVLIEAASRILRDHPSVRFLVAGKEAGVTIDVLKNQARALGVEKSFEFLGYVSSTSDFMRRCSIGVISSIGSEEVSRACLEWMAVGRPVVATTVGCLAELVDASETGFLVPPHDSVALAERLHALLKNPALSKSLGENARRAAVRRFSAEVQLQQTQEAYAFAIQRHHPA